MSNKILAIYTTDRQFVDCKIFFMFLKEVSPRLTSVYLIKDSLKKKILMTKLHFHMIIQKKYIIS